MEHISFYRQFVEYGLHGCQIRKISIQTELVKFLASKIHQNCKAKTFNVKQNPSLSKNFFMLLYSACQNPVFATKSKLLTHNVPE